jgi:hypothetical protein
MKFHSLLLFCLLFGLWGLAFTARAQSTPTATAGNQKIVDDPAELPHPDFYMEQYATWQSQVLFDQTDQEAWLNLYKSLRYRNYSERSKAIQPAARKELDDLLLLMDQHVKGSYGWHMAHYLHEEKSDEGWAHLSKAYDLNPDEPDLWDDLLCMHQVQGDFQGAAQFASKLNQAKLFSPAVMEYSRNVLRSLEPNAVLITNGYVDTYPLYVLQYVKGLRKDVRIICLEWTGSQTYVNDLAAVTGVNGVRELRGNGAGILSALTSGQQHAPLYFALTIPPDQLKTFQHQLYCTGLAMKWSAVSLANIDQLLRNWEKLFDKKHLSEPEVLNRNYLIPLVLLLRRYEEAGDAGKAKAIKELAGVIASLSGQYRIVEPYLH